MSNQEGDGGHDEGGLKREIRLEVKETRQGKLLTYADNTAPSGFRGMTELEMEVHDYIATVVARFDTEAVEPGYVGTIRFNDTGQANIEWCRDEARLAAGDGT